MTRISERLRLTTRLRKGAAITAVAIALVGGFEGLRLASYQDIVGVWTGCYGETRNMGPGLRFTREQCDNMLFNSLVEHEQGMRACIREPDTIPDESYVAFLSLAYNIGTGAFCRSTLVRILNDEPRNLRAACDQIPRWNRAGGRVVRGLVNRRAKEHELCLEGLE